MFLFIELVPPSGFCLFLQKNFLSPSLQESINNEGIWSMLKISFEISFFRP